MAQAIGKEKATGIRRMLRSESSYSWSSSSSLPGLLTAPKAYAPFVTPQFRYKLEKVAPVKPAPDTDIAPPDAPQPAKPAGDDAAPAPAPRTRRVRPPTAPVNPADDTTPDAATGQQPDTESRKITGRAQRTAPPAAPSIVLVNPAARGQTLNSNGYSAQLIYGMYGQATLNELIALFEKKLAAMRH
jgi:hypothetical protein